MGIAPSGYHQYHYASRDWRAYSDLLSKIILNSQPGKLLDLGCGCGYLVEAASLWGIDSYGFDGSDEAVIMAIERNSDLKVKHLKLSERIPFEDGVFQTVVLNQVIEHLEPSLVTHVLSEAYRVLNPKGMIIITSPSAYNKYERESDPTHINLMKPSELHKLLIDTKFSKIKSFDSVLPILGNGKLALKMMNFVFKVIPNERFSATANAMAYK
jgi:SAM-dependent methyltransferase